jgi:hypothetical protein
VDHQFNITHAEQRARKGQRGPIQAAHAIGEHRVYVRSHHVIRIELRPVLAFPNDARIRIEEGRQFFAAAALASRCSVIASIIALASGCT